MKVSIIVSHYKSPEILKLALRYVYRWKHHFEKDGDREAEIIVSDSETIPETREMMADLFPEVKYLTQKENVGFSKCVNRALYIAQGEYVFVMNADVIMHDVEALSTLIGYMEKNPKTGIAGPHLHNFDETHQNSAFRYYKPSTILMRRSFLGKTKKGKEELARFQMEDIKDMKERVAPADWLMGSALMIKKEYLDKVGYFDEKFFMYMEDVDLCRRFWEAGYSVVYIPQAKMYHYHGRSSKNKMIITALINKYTRIHLKSAIKYFRKHGIKVPKYGA